MGVSIKKNSLVLFVLLLINNKDNETMTDIFSFFLSFSFFFSCCWCVCVRGGGGGVLFVDFL